MGQSGDRAQWRETEPRLVWIWRAAPGGRAKMSAWPGLLLAWRKVQPDAPKPARWQGLVAFSRAGTLVELQWFYDTELQPVTESPPIR